jgi:teichoic acid transport system permease protein
MDTIDSSDSTVDAPDPAGTEADATAGLTSINATLSSGQYLRAMWDRREFAIEVPLEQMRSAHKTTLLGSLWHLGNPLLTIAVYYLVFGKLLSSNRPDNFLLWLTIGVFSFRLTQSTVLGGANAVSSNMGLIRAIRFPRALLPISVVISELLTFAVELGVLASIVVIGGGGISRRWLLLPVVLVIHTAFNLGGAFISARLNDSFRDIQQIIPFVFRLLQYVSGVMIPIDRLISSSTGGSWASTLVSYNPLLRIIELYRWVFLGTQVDVVGLVKTALLCFLVLWFGFRYFRAAEWRYGRA